MVLALVPYRAAITTRVMRELIGFLELDIERKKDDLALAQFHALAVSDAFKVLIAWASSEEPFGLPIASKLAEIVLRSKKAIVLHNGPARPKVERVAQVIWTTAGLLVRQEVGAWRRL